MIAPQTNIVCAVAKLPQVASMIASQTDIVPSAAEYLPRMASTIASKTEVVHIMPLLPEFRHINLCAKFLRAKFHPASVVPKFHLVNFGRKFLSINFRQTFRWKSPCAEFHVVNFGHHCTAKPPTMSVCVPPSRPDMLGMGGRESRVDIHYIIHWLVLCSALHRVPASPSRVRCPCGGVHCTVHHVRSLPLCCDHHTTLG